MKIIRDTIKSNLRYLFLIAFREKYREFREECKSRPNPFWEYERVQPQEGYHVVEFHSHTDGQQLPEIAQVVGRYGIKLNFVTDHPKKDKTGKMDDKFVGKRLLYYPVNGGVFIGRGTECECLDESEKLFGLIWRKPVRTKMLYLLHRGEIFPGQPLIETTRMAKKQGAKIHTTSTFHDGSRGISKENLLALMGNSTTDIDAIEVLDSGYGMVGLSITRHYWAEIMAKYFAEHNPIAKKAIFASNNDHKNCERGVSGNLIPESYLPCLTDPEFARLTVKDHNAAADILSEQLDKVYMDRVITPIGGYVPALSFLRKDRLETIIMDVGPSLQAKKEDLGRLLKQK
jgi:hypothetical protein